MPLPGPARLKLRSMGENYQQRDFRPVDQQIQHFQRRGIGPVRILEEHRARPPAAGDFDDVDEGPSVSSFCFCGIIGRGP